MGRLREAIPTEPRRPLGNPCTVCAFILTLDADDRADALDVLTDPTVGHTQLERLLRKVYGVRIDRQAISRCRLKEHNVKAA